jgi:hypothetical protein
MPDVAHSGEDHGQTSRISSGDHFVIPHRSARLNDCCGARFSGSQQAIGKREKRI